MYMIIVGVIFAHQLTNRMLSKGDKHPLRFVYVRSIEFFGKVVLMPAVLFAFLWTFPDGLEPDTRYGYSVFFSVLAIGIFLREMSGFRHGFSESIHKIRGKLENPASYDVTNLEIVIYNLHCFGRLSASKSLYHTWKRDNEKRILAEGRVEVPVETENPLRLPSRASVGQRESPLLKMRKPSPSIPGGGVEMQSPARGWSPADEANSDDEDTSAAGAVHRSHRTHSAAGGYEL
jgi:hypothetical protein